MVITLSGDDISRLNARLDQLTGELVPGELATFNLLELDGSELTLEILRSAADAIPFMGDRRVVIVRGLLGRFSDRGEDGSSKRDSAASGFLKDLREYLPKVPDSTVLIFLERRRLGSGAAANALRSAGAHEEFLLPTADNLPGYIARTVQERGARIERQAAALLAQGVSDNPQRVHSELDKLLAYKAEERVITAEDVKALVDMPLDVAVWDLTDALFARDSRSALRALRSLLEGGQPPQQVMGAIASQIRNLVIADASRGLNPNALAERTGMRPYAARKALASVRNFRPGEPQRLLTALTEVDLEYKTGRKELDTALELFVLKACARTL